MMIIIIKIKTLQMSVENCFVGIGHNQQIEENGKISQKNGNKNPFTNFLLIFRV